MTEPAGGLEDRIVQTLGIASRWGYGLSDAQLARLLVGGSADPAAVRAALTQSLRVTHRNGFAVLRGDEPLLAKSLHRRETNGALSRMYFGIAESFARDLLRHSPFVRSVAVSGSAASEGVGPGDDVDLNLFVEDGTKYTVYLTAVLLGLKYSLAHGIRFANGGSLLGLLPKVTCVNVVWTDSDCRPFARADEFLAYEMLRSVPIAGFAYWSEIVANNPWLADHFPQIRGGADGDRVEPPALSLLARLQRAIARSRRGRRSLERMARGISHAAYRVVDLSRGRNPEARARQEFLRQVKWPYEVFQD